MRAAAAWLAAVAVLASGCGRDSGAAARSAAARATAAAVPAATPPTRRAAAWPAHRQVITVTAPSYVATYATFRAYQWARRGWRRVFGPWTARIGNAGMAPPGAKREGDGRTPSGSFGLEFMFGALPDPAVAFRYRQAHPYDVWDDDPSSPLYNEWVDERYHDPGASPEPMDVSGYDYGVVIAYNTARTPGRGSAIFLHVNIGTATTGCVTLPMGELLTVLRWLRPAQAPRIAVGVTGARLR